MDPQDFAPKKSVTAPQIPHYYGDIVRRLFLISGVIVLITLPFNNNILPIHISLTTLLVIILIFFAAITNPFQKWVAFVNVGISILAVLTFEYFAVSGYSGEEINLFMVRQILSVIFFFALYYSGKTLRAMLLKQITKQTHI